MKEIFDKLIAMIDGIEVKGRENRARIDGAIDILRKLKDMVKVETREAGEEASAHGSADDGQGENP